MDKHLEQPGPSSTTWEWAGEMSSPKAGGRVGAIDFFKHLADHGPPAMAGGGAKYPLKPHAQNALRLGASLMSMNFGGAKVFRASIYPGNGWPFGRLTPDAWLPFRKDPSAAFVISRSVLAGQLVSQALGYPGVVDGRACYFRHAAWALCDVHSTPDALTVALVDCLKAATDLVTSPAGWRASMAYAAFLREQKRISNLPAFAPDPRSVPGLEAARAQLENDFDDMVAELIPAGIKWALYVWELRRPRNQEKKPHPRTDLHNE